MFTVIATTEEIESMRDLFKLAAGVRPLQQETLSHVEGKGWGWEKLRAIK